MKSRFIRGILLLLLMASFTALGFFGFKWWSSHQRKRALFTYFQKNSPVTQRMPSDSIFYINIYNLKRVVQNLQETRLYHVFNHYLDTNLGEQNGKPNSLMGGMLEKTFLNVFGNELGIAMAPARKGWDVIAVARLSPGSDFLLRLALAQNKKLGQESMGEDTVYTMITRNPDYPKIYLYLDSDYAYAANSMERIRQCSTGKTGGPAFLKDIPGELLPESTFLFARGSRPQFSAIGLADGKKIDLSFGSTALLHGPWIADTPTEDGVLELTTNISEILNKPAVRYVVHNVEGTAASTLLMAFDDEEDAAVYGKQITARYAPAPDADGEIAPLQYGNLDCARLIYRKKEALICRTHSLVLLADQRVDPRRLLDEKLLDARASLPVTLKLRFNRELVKEYATLVDQDDWQRFPQSESLYFLSGLKDVAGSVDGNNHEITFELE